MKNLIITITDIERSVQTARRCIKSGAKHGIKIDMYDAVTPRNTNVYRMMEAEELDTAGFIEQYSRLENCIAAFLSHYSLWKKCIQDKVTYTIFEHDAFIIQPIDNTLLFDKVISLGKPSYGSYHTPALGVGLLTSKRYFPGAHAYRLTPAGARALVKQAKLHAQPTDVFLNKESFPFLQEYYPWPVEARDSFSTIQNPIGCYAKHSLGEHYEII